MTDAILKTTVGRRDFLYVSAGAVATVGAVAAVWPFIDQMEPSAAIVAAGAPISINVSAIAPGQQIVVLWRSMPIFIVRRTPEILASLKQASLLAALRDPSANEPQQPTYAKNWMRSLNPEFLVLIGICTHLGCIPAFSPLAGSLSPSSAGGYLCHCHGSKYDMAGRVFKGVPAPYNLAVPPHHFAGTHTLVIGKNQPGESFDLSSLKQI